MRILITGANGHIGNHLCRVARGRDWSPIAFVRPGSDCSALADLELETREGDLLDAASVAAAMDGVDAVFHAGAAHRNFAKDPAEIVRPSVEGTRNVLSAMKSKGVKKLVFTSSGATVGFSPDTSKPYDESHFMDAPTNPYIRGKVEAEKLVAASDAADEVEAVIVNPSGVFGPRDYRITPAMQAIVGLLSGDPAFLHVCVTGVDDVAEGHARALERGERGERYILTGDNLTPAEVSALFHEVGGVKPPTFRPPGFLIRFLAGRAEKKAAREGTDAPITRTAIADLGAGDLVYDASKSKRALGMSYRPAREVLSDTFRWLLFRNALAPKVDKRVRAALGDAASPDPSWS